MRDYGLQESRIDLWRGCVKVSGKKLLKMNNDALQKVFGDPSLSSYNDLWKVGGVIDRAARRADNIARDTAARHFEDSLHIRKGQAHGAHGGADKGHQDMLDDLQVLHVCVCVCVCVQDGNMIRLPTTLLVKDACVCVCVCV